MGDSASVATFNNIDTVAENITHLLIQQQVIRLNILIEYMLIMPILFLLLVILLQLLLLFPVELTSFTANVVNGKVILMGNSY